MSTLLRTRWDIAPFAPADFLRADPDLHPLLLQTLHARGVRSLEHVRTFLAAPDGVPDDAPLAELDAAVAHICAAIAAQAPIAVYGDYDCDGVTACAVLHHALTAMGARFEVYIPDRFEEGYGINTAALDTLKGRGVQLVISVDCGARAMREAAHARMIGLNLIVTDHHEFEGSAMPDALAVVNPRRPDCPTRFKHLAGVGVAWRLAQALFAMHGDAGMDDGVMRGRHEADALMDLVAIGTVADVMPLTGINRAMVRAGLARINANPRPGVAALLKAARIAPGACTARDLAFGLGPRLNAAGRIENARSAFELLTTENPDWAASLAGALEDRNNKRQWLTQQTVREAEGMLVGSSGAASARDEAGNVTAEAKEEIRDESAGPAFLFAASAGFNPGIIGLVAARLMEKHVAPTAVVTIEGDLARGSCRSVNGFHITEALDGCMHGESPLLLKHGGHAAAAGFTTRVEWLPALAGRLNAIAAAQRPAQGWEKLIRADAEIQLHKLSHATHEALAGLEPHGQGNPRPTFVVRAARVQRASRMGQAPEGQAAPHLKVSVKDANGQLWDCVAWRQGDDAARMPAGTLIDMAVQIEMNVWQGNARLQLMLLDWRNSD